VALGMLADLATAKIKPAAAVAVLVVLVKRHQRLAVVVKAGKREYQ